MDRKVIEVAGHLYVEAPKCRKYRKTIYPRRTPDGYPLAGKLAARIEQATAEYEAGTNPLGLIFPSPTGNGVWAAGGPGTACGTCSARPPCSPGSLTPPM